MLYNYESLCDALRYRSTRRYLESNKYSVISACTKRRTSVISMLRAGASSRIFAASASYVASEPDFPNP